MTSTIDLSSIKPGGLEAPVVGARPLRPGLKRQGKERGKGQPRADRTPARPGPCPVTLRRDRTIHQPPHGERRQPAPAHPEEVPENIHAQPPFIALRSTVVIERNPVNPVARSRRPGLPVGHGQRPPTAIESLKYNDFLGLGKPLRTEPAGCRANRRRKLLRSITVS